VDGASTERGSEVGDGSCGATKPLVFTTFSELLPTTPFPRLLLDHEARNEMLIHPVQANVPRIEPIQALTPKLIQGSSQHRLRPAKGAATTTAPSTVSMALPE